MFMLGACFLVLSCTLKEVCGQSRGAVPMVKMITPKGNHFVISNKTEACRNLTHVVFSSDVEPVLQSINERQKSGAFHFQGNTVKCRADLINMSVYNLTLSFSLVGTMTLDYHFNYEFVEDEQSNTPPRFSVPTMVFVLARDTYEYGNGTAYLRKIGVNFTVSDVDNGDEGVVDVGLNAIWPDSYVPFGLYEENGTFFFKITGSLRDKPSLYNYLVYASDRGTPKLSGYINVTVTILNLTGPKLLPPFDQDIYTIHVGENFPASSYLFTINATDNDTHASALTYRLITMRPQLPGKRQLFEIRRNQLYTTSNISGYFDIDKVRGSELKYYLNVSVDDGLLTATTTILINITDVNDNKPVIYDTPIPYTLYENSPAGTQILRVKAKDADKTSPNNNITYSLLGRGSIPFKLNAKNGVLRLISPQGLNYTRRPFYTFIIIAKDGGYYIQHSAMTLINITIDTAPKFIVPPHSKMLQLFPEDIAPNDPIYTFEAHDADGKVTGSTVNFSIINVNPKYAETLFDMVGDTLTVTNLVKQGTFDIENNTTRIVYRIHVRASDGTYTTDTALTLMVMDVNDNTPIFTEPSYTRVIMYPFQAGDEVIQVTAIDNDLTSPNNDITYSLSGTASDHFIIHARNGSIRIASPSKLDVSKQDVYHLTVTAIDGGVPVRNSVTVPIKISITTAEEEFIIMAVLTPVIALLMFIALMLAFLVWYHKVYKKTCARKSTSSIFHPYENRLQSTRKEKPSLIGDTYSIHPAQSQWYHPYGMPVYGTYSAFGRNPYDYSSSLGYHNKDWILLVPITPTNSEVYEENSKTSYWY